MKRNKLGILVVCLIILGIICGAMMQIYINKSAKNISQELENVDEKDTADDDIVSIINNVNITDIPYDFPIEEAIKHYNENKKDK